MTDMFLYAKRVAGDPPSNIYIKLMQLFSQAQLADLGAPPDDNALEEAKATYKDEKQKREAVANKWSQMIDDYGFDVARFSITASCDFMAMCMMMIAAGSARTEGLKAAIRDQKSPGTFKVSDVDRAYLIGRGHAEEFRSAMKTWCKLKGNGIVQFKFCANDRHTFAVERTPDKNEQAEFIVYQAYQNTYSLSHFLKLKGVWNDSTLTKVQRQRWAEMSDVMKRSCKNDYTTYYQKFLIPELQNIEIARNWIGAGQRLTYDDLDVRVLEPLEMMLDGTTSHEDYIRMTGSPSNADKYQVPDIIVLMCDQVAPEQFGANYRALYETPTHLTTYADYKR